MIDRQHATLMARYNQWMNGKLYDCAARLQDAQRKEDRGAFFKSLHGTLGHLVSADTIWLHRFTGRSTEGLTLTGAYDDFDQMRARRVALDEEILAWSATLETQWLAADFSYFSRISNAHYSKPAWLLVVHLFNHQTHHRGQATTLLTQLGIDIGPTDLAAMPGT
jgi:uncharacterized damage-inducible protein DinB